MKSTKMKRPSIKNVQTRVPPRSTQAPQNRGHNQSHGPLQGPHRPFSQRPKIRPSEAPTQTLYGRHPVTYALMNPHRTHTRLRLTEGAANMLFETIPDLTQKSLNEKVPLLMCTPHQMDAQLPKGTPHQGLILETSCLPPLSLEDLMTQAPQGPYIMLDQITDPHNAGAIFRSCKALGATAVIMTERNSPDLTSPVLAKSASGALELLPLCMVGNLTQAMAQLHDAGFETIGLAEGGKNMTALPLNPTKTCLIMGAEGKGLRRLTMERATHLAALPTDASFSTLNVSIATALALHIVQQSK